MLPRRGWNRALLWARPPSLGLGPTERVLKQPLSVVLLLALMSASLLPRSASAADCNGNAIDDTIDIDEGTSDDVNENGVPDECEDCNGNGIADD